MVKVHKEIIYKLREFEPKTYELSLQKHSFLFYYHNYFVSNNVFVKSTINFWNLVLQYFCRAINSRKNRRLDWANTKVVMVRLCFHTNNLPTQIFTHITCFTNRSLFYWQKSKIPYSFQGSNAGRNTLSISTTYQVILVFVYSNPI